MKKTKRNKQLLESIFSEEEAKTSRFNAVKDWAAANKYGLGATTGVAGLSLAGWAAMRAKLQRDYNRATGEDEKRAIREKIKRLNKLALLGGLGATALTAGATLGGPAAYAAIKGRQATVTSGVPKYLEAHKPTITDADLANVSAELVRKNATPSSVLRVLKDNPDLSAKELRKNFVELRNLSPQTINALIEISKNKELDNKLTSSYTAVLKQIEELAKRGINVSASDAASIINISNLTTKSDEKIPTPTKYASGTSSNTGENTSALPTKESTIYNSILGSVVKELLID